MHHQDRHRPLSVPHSHPALVSCCRAQRNHNSGKSASEHKLLPPGWGAPGGPCGSGRGAEHMTLWGSAGCPGAPLCHQQINTRPVTHSLKLLIRLFVPPLLHPTSSLMTYVTQKRNPKNRTNHGENEENQSTRDLQMVEPTGLKSCSRAGGPERVITSPQRLYFSPGVWEDVYVQILACRQHEGPFVPRHVEISPIIKLPSSR